MSKVKKIDITLPKATVRSINRAVETGCYANASEVIHALRRWMQAQQKGQQKHHRDV